MTRPLQIVLRVVASLALLLGGCIDTSVEATTVALSARGDADADAPFDGRNGATITLQRADLAFGPLYLCAGVQAGEHCDEALAQWTDAAVIDALSPEPQALGPMEAITGTARSYMYDLGITSLLTRDEPLVSEAAGSLGDASVVIEGTAELDGQALPFTVRVRVEQDAEVEQGVPVIRSAEADGFEGALLPDDASSLEVAFDPRPWLATADFASLFEDRPCAPGVPIACAGSLEQTCDADGALVTSRECADLGQACLRGVGCAASLEVGPDSQIARALRAGVEAGARPLFTLRPETAP